MIRTGDVVLYGIDGVCRVAGKATRRLRDKSIEYFVLKPVSPENSTVYVPVGNETLVSKMQRLMSPDETIELIRSMPDEDTIWIEDDMKRRTQYARIIEGSDRTEIAKVIKTLHLRGQELRQDHRKMHAADERLMKEAEVRLYGEFAHVLKIDPDEVQPLISKLTSEQQQQVDDSGAPAAPAVP
jgi:CarD family transcriptional regulator